MIQYIHGIGIQNFKTYSSYQYCNFSTLSLLIGKNGAGKSSFLQAAQFIFKFLKNPTAFRYFPDDDFQMIKNSKIVMDDSFADNFTDISQFINDLSKPLVIDLVLDFSFDNGVFNICPIKYSFSFLIKTLEDETYLLLDGVKLFNQSNELLFINTYKNQNESFNIEFTREGIIFLLTSFQQYISKEDLQEKNNSFSKLFGKPALNQNKNTLREKYLSYEKQFLYEIDEVIFSIPIQGFLPEHGVESDVILTEINIFNDDITQNFSNCSAELQEVLNLSYQAIKSSYLINTKKLEDTQVIKISEIGFPRRTMEQTDSYLKCLYISQDRLNLDFIANNLKRFNFKGIPELVPISKDKKDFKIILNNDNRNNINLKDSGSGYWILTYLIYVLGNEVNRDKIFLIEEPETFLHPNFQADLADLFIESIELFNNQMIIETHSEYLVKRVQRRVSEANKKQFFANSPLLSDYAPLDIEIFPKDVAINYINDFSKNNLVLNIKIDENGDLDQLFPADFVDISIKEDYLKLGLKNFN